MKSQKASLEFLKEYHAMVSAKADINDLEKLKKWVNFIIKDLQLGNNIPEAILQLEKKVAYNATMMYAVILVVIAIVPVSYVTLFFCAPAAQKPHILPQWVSDEFLHKDENEESNLYSSPPF